MDILSKVFAALMALVLFCNPASAQSPGGASDTAPRWIVNCDNIADASALSCSMRMRVLQSGTSIQIISATIFQSEAGVNIMRLQLPHGINLSEGVNISIDGGAPTEHFIRTSDANGAYAPVLLSDSLVGAMKLGNTLAVDIEAASGNSISLQLSLQGFSSAFELMSQNE